jgi:hydroxymethylglutaryl-CoA lyase
MEMNGQDDVVLCECFARDGLQHEPTHLSLESKMDLMERFALAGFKRIEITSYSNPKVVPQFADASQLLQQVKRHPGVFYKATCANVRAVERAVADFQAGFGVNEISLLISATDEHSLKNLARTKSQQWGNVRDMVEVAAERFRLIGTVSMAFGCSMGGEVPMRVVLDDVMKFAQLGVKHVAIADTIGVATPQSVKALMGLLQRELPELTLIAHFHDSRGTGLVNYVAALECGVRYFDCAMGGVGGHPLKVQYGQGHTGNVCTEDWVDLLHAMGLNTGIDRLALLEISSHCEALLSRELSSHVLKSGLNPFVNGRRT